MPPTLHILTGPTAVGKTEWALRWAERYDAEIVSCDSLLFYRGMNIGTAKPSPDELRRVPHHLIDVCEVAYRMDVTEFDRRARQAVAEITGRGRRVLVVGGSGFYLRSFFAAVADEVAIPAELRREIEALSAESAVAELRRLNPGGTGGLDLSNPRRVVRALERCRATGRTVMELAAEFARSPRPYGGMELRLTVIERDRAELDRRIQVRVDEMLRAGLVDEVRRLRPIGLEQNPSAAKAIGYREVLAMLDGGLAQADLAATIARNTRALVKKQRTWFRTQLPPHRIVDAGVVTNVDQLFAPAA